MVIIRLFELLQLTGRHSFAGSGTVQRASNTAFRYRSTSAQRPWATTSGTAFYPIPHVSQTSLNNSRCVSSTSGGDDPDAAEARGKESPNSATPTDPANAANTTTEATGEQTSLADNPPDEFVMFSGASVLSDRSMDHGITDLPIMQGAGVMAPPKPELVTKYLSPDHFSSAEAYKWKKHELIRELQSFEHDTGSMPVRIGLLTQRILDLTRHTQAHRKDHHGRRGLLILLSRRRKSLRVLRRKDFDAYVKVLKRFGLKDNYYQSGWGERYRVGTNLKWSPDEPAKEKLPPAAELRAEVQAEQGRRSLKTVRAHRAVRFAMEDADRNVVWAAGAEPEGPGTGVFTPRTVKTHEYNKEKIRQRAVRMTRDWQAQLQGVREFYPEELQGEGYEQQRLQAAAQRGELSEAEMQRLREIRAAQRETQRARRRARRAEVEETVLPRYRAGPAAARRAGAAL